ncbi:MAG TPA: hypothetical protein PLP95_00395 [Microthrixaceae bacterium]|nr:hypothetical protein [Microthrixaceae bacterium]
MKRLLATTTAAALSLAMFATGCGVAADETAATVDGTDISTRTIGELAESSEILKNLQIAATSRDGVVNAEAARAALGQVVQVRAIEAFVERFGDGVTEADRAAAEAISTGATDEAFASLTTDYLAANNALTRLSDSLADMAPEEARSELFRWTHRSIGATHCIEAALVDGAAAEQFGAAVGTDAPLADIDAEAIEFTPLTDGEECHAEAVLTGFVTPIRNAPIGSWYSEEITVQGMTYTMFVKKGSEEATSLDNPATVELVDGIMSSGQTTQFLQFAAVSQARVAIDPRYGTWNVDLGAVDSPLRPTFPAASSSNEPSLEDLLGAA